MRKKKARKLQRCPKPLPSHYVELEIHTLTPAWSVHTIYGSGFSHLDAVFDALRIAAPTLVAGLDTQ